MAKIWFMIRETGTAVREIIGIGVMAVGVFVLHVPAVVPNLVPAESLWLTVGAGLGLMAIGAWIARKV